MKWRMVKTNPGPMAKPAKPKPDLDEELKDLPRVEQLVARLVGRKDGKHLSDLKGDNHG